jgi:hypothetical protein
MIVGVVGSTVKVAWTEGPTLSWTVIVYGPGEIFDTRKLPVKLPPVEPEITQLLVLTGEPDIEQVVAVPLSDPLTAIIEPRSAWDGLIEIAVTVKGTCHFTKLPDALVALTMKTYGLYIGDRVPFTTNEPEMLPLDMLHIGLAIKVPGVFFPSRLYKLQVVNTVAFPNENPEPEKVTVDPLPANVGLSEIEGVACTGCGMLKKLDDANIAEMRSSAITPSRARCTVKAKPTFLCR